MDTGEEEEGDVEKGEKNPKEWQYCNFTHIINPNKWVIC